MLKHYFQFDKDTDYMIERLLDLTYDITVCEFKHPRSKVQNY